MKLALELPTAYLEYFSKLTDFDFCLAQVALEDEAYAKFMAKQAAAGRMVLMDNGFHEMGHPLGIAELEKAVELVKPSMVIAPDWLGKPVETFDAFEAFEKRMRGNERTKLAAVMVGLNTQERAQYFMNVKDRIRTLCFPYRENRRLWFQELYEAYPPQTAEWPEFIHLLGMSDFDEAFWWKRIWPKLAFSQSSLSIDTAKPIKWGLEGVLLDFDKSPRGSKVSSATLHEVKSIEPDAMRMILRNIAYLRRFI